MVDTEQNVRKKIWVDVLCTKKVEKQCQKASLVKMKGVKHYTKDGKEFKGNTHKMPNGQVHTNKSHTKTSVRVFHFNELGKTAKKKAKSKK